MYKQEGLPYKLLYGTYEKAYTHTCLLHCWDSTSCGRLSGVRLSGDLQARDYDARARDHYGQAGDPNAQGRN